MFANIRYKKSSTNFHLITIDDENYWKNVSAENFLDTLKEYGKYYIFKIESKPYNSWYDNKEIGKLKRKKSNLNCASVITPSGEEFGELSCGFTTVNQQIELLILGIKSKNYPRVKSSSCYFNKSKSIN